MTKLKRDDAPSLLSEIAQMGSYGRAESEPSDDFLKRYLPLPEHPRALDPDVILVIGDRGAGKTELFRAIQFPAGLKAIQELGSRSNIPEPSCSSWLVGFSTTGTEFPAELVFRQFAQGKQPADLQLVWLGLLLRSLGRNQILKSDSLPVPLLKVLEGAELKLNDLFCTSKENIEACFATLDNIDAKLLSEARWVFLSYDELDRVSAGDWTQLRTILRGLVQFWSSYARRWKRLRPKIFLRRDLYDRVALFGPDVSKIASQRVELAWSTRNLYALIAKRMVNHSSLLRNYFDGSLPEAEERVDLGWLPIAPKAEDYRKFIERICGKYMGKSPSKGMSFTWVPNHLQDGNGRVLPRSIVRFFESAAEIEQTNRKAEWPRLLHHTSLRAAVDRVSDSRVQEIEDEEFPWMKTVRSILADIHPALQVPIDRANLERWLDVDWSRLVDRPPDTSGRGLLQLLMELGIFYRRADGRVDARDLYLRGFGLKRKGGVARPY